jgi:hypothetical protein
MTRSGMEPWPSGLQRSPSPTVSPLTPRWALYSHIYKNSCIFIAAKCISTMHFANKIHLLENFVYSRAGKDFLDHKWGYGFIAPFILNLDTTRRWEVRFMAWLLYLRESLIYWTGGWVGLRSRAERFWRWENPLALSRNQNIFARSSTSTPY